MLPRPPRPRHFRYTFLYSDPEQKERERRLRFQASEERRREEGAGEETLLDVGRMRRRHQAQSNRRLALVLAALVGLAALVLLW
jgi:oxalate decarboxylase/phosphoglucose isomerase-like protein (cupin superfamily)